MGSIAESPRISTTTADISEKHYREIIEGSGVDPGLIGDTFKTITAAEARALGFSHLQAREGLLIEFPAPDGEISYQLKPDKPRPDLDDAGNPKFKNGEVKRVKYETRARHDIRLGVPLPAFERVVYGTGDILVTEGAKKGFCALTLGYDPVILSGVWNWGRKRTAAGGVKYGRPELLEDWDHIPLEGRRITLVPDADYKSNPQVARAFKTLADRLTERGARVHIADLPGPEKGLDDFVVAGGDLHKVIRGARPYDPTLFTPYTVKESPRLRDAIGRVQQAMDRCVWEWRSGKTDHSLLRALVELALERGRVEGGEPEVVASTREVMRRAGVGSRATLTKSTARLEAQGYVEKISGDRAKGQANRYRLKFSKGVPGVDLTDVLPSPAPSISGTETANFTPHLRWAAPPPSDRPPEDIPGRQSRPTERSTSSGPMNALGKVAEFCLNRLSAWGGEGTLRDLATASGVSDTSKVRRALADLEDAGVLSMDPKGKHGARVRLAPDWRAKLDERRELGGELARTRRQAVSHRRDRVGFMDRGKADKAPSEDEMMGPERAASVVEVRREEYRKREWERSVREREVQGRKARAFVQECLDRLGCIRYGLIRDIWKEDHRGSETDLRRALRDRGHPLRPHAEHPGELFVYPSEREPKPEAPREPVPTAPERAALDRLTSSGGLDRGTALEMILGVREAAAGAA